MAIHSSILAWKFSWTEVQSCQAIVHGVAESEMTVQLSTHTSSHSIWHIQFAGKMKRGKGQEITQIKGHDSLPLCRPTTGL